MHKMYRHTEVVLITCHSKIKKCSIAHESKIFTCWEVNVHKNHSCEVWSQLLGSLQMKVKKEKNRTEQFVERLRY